MPTLKTKNCSSATDVSAWHNKTFEWTEKRFIKSDVSAFLTLPLNINRRRKQLLQHANIAGADIPEGMCMAVYVSEWKIDMYLAVDKYVPEVKNITMNGKYFSQVLDYAINNIQKCYSDFQKSLEQRGFKLKDDQIFFWYTLCPQCSKYHGQRHLILIARIE